jgi:RNase P protein component
MISVELTSRFKKIVRSAGREQEVLDTLTLMTKGFGHPHLHSGLSIRKLDQQLFECRTSLQWRLIFVARKGVLTFDFAGNHQEVQNYLRGR